MISKAVTVSTTATLICPSDDKHRVVYIHNGGGSKIYIGGSDVSTTNGFHLANNENVTIEVPTRETLHAVVASSTNVVNVLTPDLD